MVKDYSSAFAVLDQRLREAQAQHIECQNKLGTSTIVVAGSSITIPAENLAQLEVIRTGIESKLDAVFAVLNLTIPNKPNLQEK